MTEPLLYLSLYLKTNREMYYDLLQGMRDTGDWEDWLRFFLQGVWETAEEASRTTRTVLQVFGEDRQQIEGLGRAAASALRVFSRLQATPLLSIRKTADALGLSVPTVIAAVKNLETLGVVQELTGRRRDRLFVYGRYLDILNEGAEPIPRG